MLLRERLNLKVASCAAASASAACGCVVGKGHPVNFSASKSHATLKSHVKIDF
jgi:hypothetical protein